MDADIQELIRELGPEGQELLERLLAGEWPPADMFPIIIAIWEAAGRNSQLIWRLFALLVRSGQLPARILERLWSFLNLPAAEAAAAGGAEGAAAAGGAEGATAAGGAAVEGGAAGGTTVVVEGTGGAVGAGIGATVAATAFAVAAVALAAYLIGREANRQIVELPGGTPCGKGPAALATATTPRTVTVDAFGGRNSYNQAIEQAQAICAGSAGACSGGGCSGGGECKPNVSVQTVDQTFYFFFTRTLITFTCPCECL